MDIKFIKTADGPCYVDITATTATDPTGRYNLPAGAGYNCDVAANKHTIMAPNLPGGKLRFLTTEINTGSSSPALVGSGTAALYTEINNGFFRKALGGGGSIIFTVLAADVWSGFQRKTLSANLVITTGDSATGILHITNPASYSVMVNGKSIPVNNSGTNGGITSLTYYTLDNGTVVVSDKAGNPIETVRGATPTSFIDTVFDTALNNISAAGTDWTSSGGSATYGNTGRSSQLIAAAGALYMNANSIAAFFGFCIGAITGYDGLKVAMGKSGDGKVYPIINGVLGTGVTYDVAATRFRLNKADAGGGLYDYSIDQEVSGTFSSLISGAGMQISGVGYTGNATIQGTDIAGSTYSGLLDTPQYEEL